MKKYIIAALVCCGVMSGKAQQTNEFISPIDFPMYLSANFGELRPNHFHNGIDIKTQGVVGKRVVAVADGYVSRIVVMHGGYGQVLFVNHPNGLTSVYGHVKDFAPKIHRYVRDYQYANQTFVCNLYPKPGELPVKQGELIALSGNEGASQGPHLHFEFRRTATNTYIDPIPYFKRELDDNRAPVASLIALYPVQNKGMVDGTQQRKLLPVSRLNEGFTAWGDVYAGISAHDVMDGTSNIYGVYKLELFVDSIRMFSSVIDEVSGDENRMINAYTDYAELMRTRRLIMRSYLLPQNTLNFLRANPDRGIVRIDKEKPYHFRYVLTDHFGNQRSYSFVVEGKRQPIIDTFFGSKNMLYAERTNFVRHPGFEMVIPKGYVYDNTPYRTEVVMDSSRISFQYRVEAQYVPLHNYCPIQIGIRHQPVADTTKYYIERVVGKSRFYVGGRYEKGWMKGQVRDFGSYRVAVDTVAPVVVPVGQRTWRRTRNVRFRVSDNATGIASYKVLVDGQFVLFGLKRGLLIVQDVDRLPRGGVHEIEVIVTDRCGNVARRVFNY